ncbi:hypothetical protein R1sor_006005 [Riccia sorocarpa]|uniref:Uncharacterized protein n=1 Tax=Riccia sorocarpa TaxID=122646 RepID=A0ABD3HPV3_9MARC
MERAFWNDIPKSVMDSQAQSFLPQQGAPGEFTSSFFQPHFTFPVARPVLDMNQSADVFELFSDVPPQPVRHPEEQQQSPVGEDNSVPAPEDRRTASTPEKSRRGKSKSSKVSRRSNSSHVQSRNRSVSPEKVNVGDNIDPDSDNEDGAGGDGDRGRKWCSKEIVILLELTEGIRPGQQPWESMTADERKQASLPLVFKSEHLRILDSFMKDRAAQNPASMADSSINPESCSLPSSTDFKRLTICTISSNVSSQPSRALVPAALVSLFLSSRP